MMRNINRFGLIGIMAVGFLISGCLLISGTFIIVEDFDFTTRTGFYHYYIDLTDNSDWEDHKDEIDQIDLVGFEMDFINNESESVTFNIYLSGGEAADSLSNVTEVESSSSTVQILGGLTVPVGNSHTTYGESLKYIMNVEALKKLVKAGKFHYYGFSSAGTDAGFEVENGKIIVTFTAHGSGS